MLDDAAPSLHGLGYEAKGEYGIPGRRYFQKRSTEGTRTHHLHGFQAGSPQIARHLQFRDYLIDHSKAALEYSNLKTDLARRFKGDRERYSDGKTAFITRIEQALHSGTTWAW